MTFNPAFPSPNPMVDWGLPPTIGQSRGAGRAAGVAPRGNVKVRPSPNQKSFH